MVKNDPEKFRLVTDNDAKMYTNHVGKINELLCFHSYSLFISIVNYYFNNMLRFFLKLELRLECFIG